MIRINEQAFLNTNDQDHFYFETRLKVSLKRHKTCFFHKPGSTKLSGEGRRIYSPNNSNRKGALSTFLLRGQNIEPALGSTCASCGPIRTNSGLYTVFLKPTQKPICRGSLRKSHEYYLILFGYMMSSGKDERADSSNISRKSLQKMQQGRNIYNRLFIKTKVLKFNPG